MGSIYRRGDSKFWWIAYYQDGRQFLESTRPESENYAKNLLKLREGEIAQGKQPAVLYDRVRFDELLDDLLTDYRINKRKNLYTPGDTKNDKAREVYLNEECLRDITYLYSPRGNCPFVFHLNGRRIRDFRDAWRSCSKKAGLAGTAIS